MPFKDATPTRWAWMLVLTLLCGIALTAAGSPARADWTPSDNLMASGKRALGNPQIGYDASGRSYAAWAQYEGTYQDVVYLRERPPGGPWGPAQILPVQTGSYVRDLSLAVASNGDLVVAWRSGAIYAMRRPAGGNWGPKVAWNSPGISGPASGCPLAPDAAVGSDGSAVVTWTAFQSCNGNVTQWRVMAASYVPGTGWQAQPTVWDQSAEDVHSRPAAAVDDLGRATVVFNARGTGFNDQLWSVQGQAGVWDAPTLRGGSGSADLFTGPEVIASGNVTAVSWYEGPYAWAAIERAGSWGSAQVLSPGAAQSSNSPPGVAVGAAGTVHVSWTAIGGGHLIAYVSTSTGGSFSTEDVGRPGVNSQSPRVAANTSGDLVAVWDEIVGGAWRAVSALRPAGGAWPATPTPLTSTPSSNGTQARAEMDPFGHALVVTTPIVAGFATEFDVAIETRDPAVEPATAVTISPAVVEAGGLLSCDADGFMGTPPFRYSYEWLVEGVVVDGQTASTYVASRADAGLGVACRVTATNEAGAATSTSDRVVIGVTPPAFTSSTTLSGVVEAGNTLSCIAGATTGAPAPDLSFAWLRNGSPIGFETSATFDVSVADAGSSLACQVTATNDAGSDVSSSAPVSVPAVVGPVVLIRPSLTGPTAAGLGSTLSCSTGTWSGAPAPTYLVEWLRDGVLVTGANSATYDVTSDDAGTTITCQVTASNVVGETTSPGRGSRAIPLPPVNTILPSVRPVSGATWAVGQGAQCTTGGWSRAVSYTYAWLRDGVPIPEGTARLRTLVQADAGTTLSCQVTAVGRGGSATAVSAGRALAAPPAVVTAPSITGTPRPGRTLTCARGSWTDATSYLTAWERGGVTIAGATTNKFIVPASAVGAVVTCTVTAVGPGGQTSATSAGVLVRP